MKKHFKFATTVLFSLGLIGAVRAAGLDGKWHAEFDSQIGQIKYDFEFKTDGEKVTGKTFVERQGQKFEGEIKNGKIVKDDVSFTEPMKFQDQEILVEFKGKLAGDELKLHRKVGDIAEYDIVAKRVKEDAPKK